MKLINIFYLVLFVICFISCHKDISDSISINQVSDYKSDVAIDWINLQRELVQYTPGYSSPVAARAYAYASLAMYESVVVGIKGNLSYSGQITEYTAKDMPVVENGKEYNWELVVNACMAEILKQQFKLAPIDKFQKIDLLTQKYFDLNSKVDINIRERSIDYGKKAATAIYNYSKTDGQDEAYLNNYPDYNVPNTPGHWEPSDPKQLNPLQAYWGEVRPFLVSNITDDFILKYGPVIYYSTDSKSAFYAKALESYTKGLDSNIKWISEFWDDDAGISATPAGHSMAIALKIIKDENMELAQAVEVISKVGIIGHDAFVYTWKSKFKYNLLRPETYIRKFIDPNYPGPLQNPLSSFKNNSYPSFPSEHAIHFAATMEVLAYCIGYSYAITAPSNEDPSTFTTAPRSYHSLNELSQEAAWSRALNGTQFRQDLDLGAISGTEIGRNFENLVKLKK